jgi:hypothetical protein
MAIENMISPILREQRTPRCSLRLSPKPAGRQHANDQIQIRRHVHQTGSDFSIIIISAPNMAQAADIRIAPRRASRRLRKRRPSFES